MSRIAAAAVRYNGEIRFGRQHASIMQDIWREEEQRGLQPTRITQEMQGFVDDEGRFLSRSAAGYVAFQAQQTETHKESLFSEDLW